MKHTLQYKNFWGGKWGIDFSHANADSKLSADIEIC
jgi:hypothetical protein